MVTITLSEAEAKALRDLLRAYGSNNYVTGTTSAALWGTVDQIDDQVPDDDS